jgi:CHAT domain-containing protein
MNSIIKFAAHAIEHNWELFQIQQEFEKSRSELSDSVVRKDALKSILEVEFSSESPSIGIAVSKLTAIMLADISAQFGCREEAGTILWSLAERFSTNALSSGGTRAKNLLDLSASLFDNATTFSNSDSRLAGLCAMGKGLALQRLATLGINQTKNSQQALTLFGEATRILNKFCDQKATTSCKIHYASSLIALADLGNEPEQGYRKAVEVCWNELEKALTKLDCGQLLVTLSDGYCGMGRLGLDPSNSFKSSLIFLNQASSKLKAAGDDIVYGVCLIKKSRCLQLLAEFDTCERKRLVKYKRARNQINNALKKRFGSDSHLHAICLFYYGELNQRVAQRVAPSLLSGSEKDLHRDSIEFFKKSSSLFAPETHWHACARLNEAVSWESLSTIGSHGDRFSEAAYYINAFSKYTQGLQCLEAKSMARAEYTQKVAMVLMKLSDLTNVKPSGILGCDEFSVELVNAFFNGKQPTYFLNEAHRLMCQTVMPILEQIAGSLQFEAERRAFRETQKTSYQLITALCLDMAEAEAERNSEQAEALRWEAWQWVQRGKARTLQESMENLRLNDQPLSDAQAAEFDALMAEFRDYDQSHPNPDGGRGQEEAAADPQAEWHQRVAKLLASLVTAPKVGADTSSEPASEPERTIPSLDEQNQTVVIEFFSTTKDRVGAFMHRAGLNSKLLEPVWLGDEASAQIKSLGQRQREAIEVLRRIPRMRVREGCLQRAQPPPSNDEIAKARREMRSIAAALGELLTPVRERIADQRWDGAPLLLCPTGALHMLPLAAADWGEDAEGMTRPWIAAHPLVHLQTVKLASDVVARVRSDNADDSTPKYAYIAATDPWDRLGQIYTEAEHAKKVLECKSYTVSYFPRAVAKLSTLRENGTEARVVHLAMHSGMHPSRFEYCGVEFHDSRLTVLELLLRLRLMNAQLAIVATCSSNQPRELLADDPSVITRAWMVSGAASIIGSLWPLDDESAMQFSRHFYEAWAGDATKGKSPLPVIEALQHGILKVREADRDDLYAWAPYTLVGHGGTMM